MNLIKEILLYLIFVYLLLMVSYGNRDPWAHYYYHNVKNMMAHGKLAPKGYNMDAVSICYVLLFCFLHHCDVLALCDGRM